MSYARRCTHTAVCGHRKSLGISGGPGIGPCVERSEPSAERGKLKQGEVWRWIHKVVHPQGGAHTRRSLATVGVLLLKGVRGLAPCPTYPPSSSWCLCFVKYKNGRGKSSLFV